MADESDVRNALVALIGSIVFPTGSTSITGKVVRVYPGWPDPVQLDKDIAAGKSTITVYADPHMQRNTTRYISRNLPAPAAPISTLIPVVMGTEWGFTGICTAGLVASVIVDDASASYLVKTGDTPTSVEAALEALLPVNVSPRHVVPRVGVPTPSVREGARIFQSFQVLFWTPDASARDTLSAPVIAALLDLDWLSLPDQSARMRFERVVSLDEDKTSLYRRSLTLSIEYASTIVSAVPVVTVVETTQSPGAIVTLS